jgi:hypothetical protein
MIQNAGRGLGLLVSRHAGYRRLVLVVVDEEEEEERWEGCDGRLVGYVRYI